MSDSKHPTFKLDDDKDVLGRLCALSWFDGVRGEYELLVNLGEDDARELVAKLTAWLDAPRLAEAATVGDECQNNSPAGFTGHWRDWHRGHGCDKDPGRGGRPCGSCGAKATMGDHCMACASREAE